MIQSTANGDSLSEAYNERKNILLITINNKIK